MQRQLRAAAPLGSGTPQLAAGRLRKADDRIGARLKVSGEQAQEFAEAVRVQRLGCSNQLVDMAKRTAPARQRLLLSGGERGAIAPDVAGFSVQPSARMLRVQAV